MLYNQKIAIFLVVCHMTEVFIYAYTDVSKTKYELQLDMKLIYVIELCKSIGFKLLDNRNSIQ